VDPAHHSDTSGVENLGGWLTTVVARVCLNMLQSRKSRGVEAVAGQALAFSRSRRLLPFVRPVLVNGAPGFVSRTPDGRPLSVVGITVAGGKIVEIDILSDPERLRGPNLADLDEGSDR